MTDDAIGPEMRARLLDSYRRRIGAEYLEGQGLRIRHVLAISFFVSTARGMAGQGEELLRSALDVCYRAADDVIEREAREELEGRERGYRWIARLGSGSTEQVLHAETRAELQHAIDREPRAIGGEHGWRVYELKDAPADLRYVAGLHVYSDDEQKP